jgi:hypothetical protein
MYKWTAILGIWFVVSTIFALLIAKIIKRRVENQIVLAWDEESTRNLR